MVSAGEIQYLAKQNFSEVQAHRHHLHANPELSFKEFETANYIAGLKETGKKSMSMAAYKSRKAENAANEDDDNDQIVESTVVRHSAGDTVTEAAPIQSVSSDTLTESVKSKELTALTAQSNTDDDAIFSRVLPAVVPAAVEPAAV